MQLYWKFYRLLIDLKGEMGLKLIFELNYIALIKGKEPIFKTKLSI